jgi:hypothetical protein
MQHSMDSNLIIKYVREYEFLFEMAMNQGTQGYCLPKKTEG